MLSVDQAYQNQHFFEVPISVQSDHFNHVEFAFIAPPEGSHRRRSTIGVYVTICLPTARTQCTTEYITGYKIDIWYVINLTNSFQIWLSNPENIFNQGNETAIVKLSVTNIAVETTILAFRVLESRVHSYPFIGRVKRQAPSFLSSSRGLPARQSFPVSGGCRLVSWYISFNDLNMREYVASPGGATVNYCIGTCVIRPDVGNITSHAYMSSLYKARQEDLSPADLRDPSCVPSKLSPINVIFKQRAGYRLITIHNMEAEACTCAWQETRSNIIVDDKLKKHFIRFFMYINILIIQYTV